MEGFFFFFLLVFVLFFPFQFGASKDLLPLCGGTGEAPLLFTELTVLPLALPSFSGKFLTFFLMKKQFSSLLLFLLLQ